MQPVSTRVRPRHAPRDVHPRARRVRTGLALFALTVAVLVIGGQTLASGAGNAPTASTPLAQVYRMTVSNTASTSDPHLQVAVVQAGFGASTYIAQLRSQHPGIRILLYKTLWWLRPSDSAGYANCLPGSGSYPESWYLHNTSGAREAWNAGTSQVQYAMDFGNTSYAQACAQKLVSDAKAWGANGVMFDGSPTSLYWSQLPGTCGATTCASNSNWQTAMTAALYRAAVNLHASGFLVYANISGGNIQCCSGGPAVWQRYMSVIDGGMEESWTYGTNHLPVRTSQVQTGIMNIGWAESHGKHMLVNDDVTNCEACSDYGLATMLLVTNGATTYDTANGTYRGSYGPWWPSYTTAQSLGSATGAARTLASGLLFRPFTGGYVVVNITASAISDPTYGYVAAYSALIK